MDKCIECLDYFHSLLTGNICGDCFVELNNITFCKPTEKERNKMLDDKQRADDMRQEFKKHDGTN